MRLSLLPVLVLLAGCGSEETVSAPPPPTQSAPPGATTETAPPETPADEPAKPLPPIPRRDDDATGPHPELFFYFPGEQSARAAAADLERHGYRVRTAPPADDVPEWSVIAEGTPDAPDLEAAERAFGPWARARGGEYDGNEIPVGP